MVVVGAGPLMPPGTLRLKPGNIKVVVAPEISTTGLTYADIPKLKALTFDVMTQLIVDHR